MRTIKKILAIMFVAATMTMVACSKDKDDKPTTPDTLSGSTWVGSGEQEMMGMHVKIDMTMAFVNATEGEMTVILSENGEAEAPKTAPFAYTYTAPNGTITGIDEEGDSHTAPFTVNGNKLTITDWDMEVTLTRQ